MNDMRVIEAIQYLNYGVKEGFIDEGYAQELLDKPYPEFLEIISGLMARGENYYDSLKENENSNN